MFKLAAIVMDVDWTRLPEDLLSDIAMRLEYVQDLVVFSAVCSSWNSVYANVKSIWTPAMPWLILPYKRTRNQKRKRNPLCIRTVFDPNANKTYQMELPETFGRRCWGCGDGWIFTLGLSMKIHLFNPLTRTRLTLPPAQTLPLVDRIDYHDTRYKKKFRRECIEKVNLLTIPPNNELLVLVVYNINSFAKCFAFAKPGDSVWTAIGKPAILRHYVQDVVCFQGQNLIVYEDGTLAVLDMDFFLHPEREIFKAVEYLPRSKNTFLEIYLVESFSRLLLVQRTIMDYDSGYDTDHRDPTIGYETESFDVFMFDFEARDWMVVDDLGDVALFVGNNSAMSVCASKSVNCKPNCIYFTDEKPNDDLRKFVGRDMGVYNLKDRSIEVLHDGDDVLSKFCPPFWFMPKLVDSSD